MSPGEDPLEVARREYKEETGCEAAGDFIPLTALKQPSGKIISAWAFAGDCDPETIKSNTFLLEWPPHSGQQQEFPEVDRAAWFKAGYCQRENSSGSEGFYRGVGSYL